MALCHVLREKCVYCVLDTLAPILGRPQEASGGSEDLVQMPKKFRNFEKGGATGCVNTHPTLIPTTIPVDTHRLPKIPQILSNPFL